MLTLFQKGLGEEIRSVSEVRSDSKRSHEMAAHHRASRGRTVRCIQLSQDMFSSFESLFSKECNILVEGLVEQRLEWVHQL